MRKKISGATASVVILVVIVLSASPFLGLPWGWRPSYGSSYGDSVKGIVWTKEHKLSPDDHVRVGQNVTFSWKGEGVVKRVKKLSPDGGWLWVSGDNTADGATLSSYEVGWLVLPCAQKPAPATDPLVVSIAPKVPVEAEGVISDFWAPFDRRSSFEKATRFFNRPEDVIVAGKWLILRGEVSCVYDRQSGRLVWEVPGLAIQSDGLTLSFSKSTNFSGDPQMGLINLATGEIKLSALPQIAAPKAGQVDLRDARISTTSRIKNPVNVFDGDQKTFWGIGQGSGPLCSIRVDFPTPTKVHTILIDSTLMYGATLTVTVKSRKGERTIQPGQAIDEQVDGFTITLRQYPVHQPVTGAVREVEVYEK